MREGRAEPCPYGVGMQKNRPYQLDIYTVSFHAIPRQAREQGGFDTFLWGECKREIEGNKREIQGNKKGMQRKQQGDIKEIKREMQKGKEKGKEEKNRRYRQS